jgi:hypothetical protein
MENPMDNKSAPRRPIAQHLLLGLGLSLGLAACGSDDDSSPVATTPTTPVVAVDQFVFASNAPDRYARVDRTGEPAIATALLSRDPAVIPRDANGVLLNAGATSRANGFDNQRDALNRGDPINDGRDFAGMLTVGPQGNSLRNLHFKVGPALRALGLTPCSTETVTPPPTAAEVDISNCVAQVAPVVLPDVISYDFDAPAGWPNGRGFDDPVVDRLLAAALLQVSGTAPKHTINSLVGVINPTQDEAGTPLPAAFPHLRVSNP